jgi:hypothetical protein
MDYKVRQFGLRSLAFIFAVGCSVIAVKLLTVKTVVQIVQTEPIKSSEIIEQSSKQLLLPSNPKLIVAGESVGMLRLGESRERMLELFPKKPNYDLEYNYDKNCCGCDYSSYHWLPPDFKSNGLFFYLKQGRIYQISVQTDLFTTSKGIKQDSTPREVRRHFPSAKKAFVYLNSSSKFSGWRNVVYWVDNDSGIAFEFYYHPKKRQRYVNAIIVFEPKTEFQPDGCTSSLREFTEITPFTVEPPEWMQQDFDRRHNIKRNADY